MLRIATVFLTIFSLLCLGSLQAQNKANIVNKTAKILTLTGDEVSTESHNVIQPTKTVYPDVVRGILDFQFSPLGLYSGYDLQSNGTTDELWQDPTDMNNLHAVYMNSQQTGGSYSDRTITYFNSFDGGMTWFSIANIPSTGEKSGYPSVNGFDNGTEIIACHTNTNATTTRTKIYIDQSAGSGTFDECDPGSVTDGDPIWPRLLGIGNDSYAFVSSISGAPNDDAYFNTGDVNCTFSGYEQYLGDQAETYSLAYDENSGTLGHLYLANNDVTVAGNLYYRETNDFVTWGPTKTLWTFDPVDSLGVLRGCDLVMLGSTPYAVFEVDKMTQDGSFFPAYPSSIYLWSPAVNNGEPLLLADSSMVPYGINYNSANDVTTPLCRPTIGKSTGALSNNALFVAFMAATDQYMGDPNGTANTFYAGYFTFSVDSGNTWSAPVKFTPDETPLRDWRYISLSQKNIVTDDSVCTVHMVVQADTIPGSTVNNTDPNYPVAVSAELIHVSTDIVIPQPTGIADENNNVYSFNLAQNYPNPFNPTTKITYSVPQRNQVSLKVYDMLGREVANLVNTTKDAGTYEVNFNASNLASGLYIYKIQAGNFVQSKKMMLLK